MLEKVWQEFLKAIINDGEHGDVATEAEIRSARRVFYVGALASFAALKSAFAERDLNAGIARLTSVESELTKFHEDLKNGQA